MRNNFPGIVLIFTFALCGETAAADGIGARLFPLRPFGIASSPPLCASLSVDKPVRSGSGIIQLIGGRFDVSESMVLNADESKEPSRETGDRARLKVVCKLGKMAVEIDGRLRGYTPLILTDLKPGMHRVRFSKKGCLNRTERVILQAGVTIQLEVTMIEQAHFAIDPQLADAEIRLDGVRTNPGSGEKIHLSLGDHQLEAKSSGYENLSRVITLAAGDNKTIELEMQQKKPRRAVVKSILWPGWGQRYAERGAPALVYPAVELGALAGVFLSIRHYNDAVEKYEKSRINYSSAIDEADLVPARRDMQRRYKEISDAQTSRNILIAAAVGIWVWNVVDVVIWPPPRPTALEFSHRNDSGIHLYGAASGSTARIGLCWQL